MSTEVRLRRGTTAQHSTFIGAQAEVTIDTDKKAVVIHDGVTAGGFPALRADAVSAFGLTLVDDANAESARSSLIIASAPRVSGLIGNVNAVTPLTKYDLSALSVVLRDVNGGTVARYATGTITCDLGLAGSAANGRDQAAAFTANSWIYLYFIWNGTTLATIASLSATAPTLPSGYTHYAFATVLRWNASSNIVAAYTSGSTVEYGASIRVLSAGVATSYATVSFSSAVPPNHLVALFNVLLLARHTVAGVEFGVTVRKAGASTGGIGLAGVSMQVANVLTQATVAHRISLGPTQQIQYTLNAAPNVEGGAYIDVTGYTIPNGDC